MAKITKTLAESVSLQMTVGLEEKREAIRKEIAEFLRAKKEAQIPEAVKEFAQRFPTYFKTVKRLYPTCGQLSEYERYGLEEPVICTQHSDGQIDLCSSDYEWFLQTSEKGKSFKRQREKLCRQIEATLLALSTPKRIAEQFPQALPFLPADFLDNKSTVPAIQMGDLLAQLEQIKTL